MIINNLSQEELNILIDCGVRSSIINGIDWKDLTEFSFKFVKYDVVKCLNNDDTTKLIELGQKELGINKKIDVSDKEIISFILWLKDEIERIAELERTYLSSPPKAEMQQAGIDKFEVFSVENVVYSLVDKYRWKPDEVRQMKYNEVFSLQLYNKISNEYAEKFHEIKSKQNK